MSESRTRVDIKKAPPAVELHYVDAYYYTLTKPMAIAHQITLVGCFTTTATTRII
jgi:hypothetical protein